MKAASSLDDGAPTKLGRYELVRPLAKGGMAQIHLARYVGIGGLETLAVIKQLRDEQAGDEDVVKMFLREVSLLSAMKHPNVVQVYDAGVERHGYWFAMEFLNGQDLRSILIRSAPLPIEHALTVMTGALSGLHYVHEGRDESGQSLGIVHRDVSPANIFVTYDGKVKLLDFGVAKSRFSQSSLGVLKGKIRYMAPEQVNSEPIDRRVDVFAAGIVLWEMTVGRRLFDGLSDIDVLLRIAAHDAPAPSSLMSGYPAELERIVMKALQREPSARYQTTREMQLDLETYARTAGLPLS